MTSDQVPQGVEAQGAIPTLELDERGTRCPQPIISLGKAAVAIVGRTRIVLLADDPAALIDVPAWCRMTSATLLGTSELSDGSGTRFELLVTPDV